MSALDSVRARLAVLFAPASQRWHRLDARRQQMLGAGTLLLIALLLIAYVWLPALRERDRLSARLPQLRAQLAAMRAEADEVRRISSVSAIAPAPAVAADAAALQQAFGEGARVSVDAGRAFRVVIARIAYATWWDRLAEVQARHRLGLVSLTLSALPGTSREVSIDMQLADRPAGGAPK